MQEKNTLDELFKGKKGFAECYQTLQLLSESTDDYLFLADLKEGKFYFASNDISKRYALRMDENNSCSINDWKDIVYGRDLNQWVNDMESICSGKSLIHDLEYRLVDRNSNLVWISCRGKAELDETGIPYVMVGRTSDTVLLGKTDSLTGLFNSTKLMEHLDEMLNSRKEGVLLVLGVDNFKNINTKYGRGHGNFILKRIAALLENSIDENIKIYRQKKGYTQEEVANRLHVTRQTVSKWEKNYSVPDVEVFVKLADVLEVQTSQLLEVKVGSDVQTTEEKQNAYAEQLAHIAEQMAIRNRQRKRIWKTIGIAFAVIIVVCIILIVMNIAFFSAYPTTEDVQTHEETIMLEE